MHPNYNDQPAPYGPLHAVLWPHISILLSLLAAEPRNTAGLLIPTQCLCGTILPTLYPMVWDWQVSRVVLMLFYWPQLLDPFLSSTDLYFSSFFL